MGLVSHLAWRFDFASSILSLTHFLISDAVCIYFLQLYWDVSNVRNLTHLKCTIQ